jgi:UDP-glucose 4-epimerase
VKDTIRALRDLMIDINRTSGEIFNIGANNQTTIIGLADTIRHLTGSDSPTVHIPFNEVYGTGIEDMLHRVPCIDKVRTTIGWEPTRNLEDILNDVIVQAAMPVAMAA